MKKSYTIAGVGVCLGKKRGCEALAVSRITGVPMGDKAAAQADPDVQAAVSEIAAKLGDTGRILVRESGTEPVIRVMVEAQSAPLCQECVDRVVDVIKRKGHAV